jgi:hypothetical protein
MIFNKFKITKDGGITLIALVITIIVMLILAGVSLNAMIGNNGVITQAQKATYAQKVAKYKEELEMNLWGTGEITAKSPVPDASKITLMNENVKQYITSLEDNDVGKYAIVEGKLYYLGEVELEKEVCKEKEIGVTEEGETAEDFVSKVETIAIENILKNMVGNSFTETDENGNEEEIGVKLWDKNFQNGNKWKIITEVENNETKATYGTGWYYVTSGTTIPDIGVLKNSYIINYDEQKAVKFDGKIHTMLAYGGNLSVKDSLIFNADPINLENINSNSNIDSSIFGDNVTLHGFENNDINLVDNYAFNFDGVDDYITIPYDSSNSIENGFTYEIFGKINSEGTSYNSNGVAYNNWFSGMFCLWNGNEKKQAKLRFGAILENSSISCFEYNLGWISGLNYYGSFTSPNYYNNWGQYLELSNYGETINFKDEFYLTIVVDMNNLIQTFYLNGEKLDSGDLSRKYVNNFLNNDLPNLNTFCLGRSSMHDDGYWHYSDASVYSLRLYNRPLSDSEVTANYNSTVSYRNILLNGGEASTGGDTEGEDLSNIN